MIRIRRIQDPSLNSNRGIIAQVQDILRAQFPLAPTKDATGLPRALVNPFELGLRTLLYVAERKPGVVAAFAWMYHDPTAHFVYLDYISTAPRASSGGLGDALYGAMRDVAKGHGAHAIYMECLPDDPELCDDPEFLPQNRARLRFYERFGARPVVGTAYEESIDGEVDGSPYLVIDPLDGDPPSREQAREVVRAILERKYGWLCPQDYVERVVDSFRDDPVRLRPPRFKTAGAAKARVVGAELLDTSIGPFVLVTSDKHEIHHVRERGYVESPARVARIRKAVLDTALFEEEQPKHFPDKHILAVHDPNYVKVFKAACNKLEPGKPVYPYVFPIRNRTRPPSDMGIRAGYYCIDTFTPLTYNAYIAARRAVDCAMTAVELVSEGAPLAYALVRPPGHHAERGYYGGFCYFCNSAIAAHWLSSQGRVALLDVDYHHGNGQQDIFYDRADVLTVSLHGDPKFAYPYFTGFKDETGEGAGEGFNMNLALPEHLDGEGYRKALRKALTRIVAHDPAYLVVSLGLDTAKGDPTGTWTLAAPDFEQNGRMIGELGLRTVVIQEGGYDVRAIGRNAAAFFAGLAAGLSAARRSGAPPE